MRLTPVSKSPDPDYPDLPAFVAERRAFLLRLGAVAGALLLAGCDARSPIAATPVDPTPANPPADPTSDPPLRTKGEAPAPELPPKTAGAPVAPAKEPELEPEQIESVQPNRFPEAIRGKIKAPSHPREDVPPGK